MNKYLNYKDLSRRKKLTSSNNAKNFVYNFLQENANLNEYYKFKLSLHNQKYSKDFTKNKLNNRCLINNTNRAISRIVPISKAN